MLTNAIIGAAPLLAKRHWWIINRFTGLDTIRLVVGLLSLSLALTMVIRLRANYTPIRLACIFLFVEGGADEILLIGQPFVIYRLPLRALCVVLMWIGVTTRTPKQASAEMEGILAPRQPRSAELVARVRKVQARRNVQ